MAVLASRPQRRHLQARHTTAVNQSQRRRRRKPSSAHVGHQAGCSTFKRQAGDPPRARPLVVAPPRGRAACLLTPIGEPGWLLARCPLAEAGCSCEQLRRLPAVLPPPPGGAYSGCGRRRPDGARAALGWLSPRRARSWARRSVSEQVEGCVLGLGGIERGATRRKGTRAGVGGGAGAARAAEAATAGSVSAAGSSMCYFQPMHCCEQDQPNERAGARSKDKQVQSRSFLASEAPGGPACRSGGGSHECSLRA